MHKLGVLYYHFPDIEDVNKLAAERGYKNRDEIVVSPDSMGKVYEEKVKNFFQEHLHEDEEIRYIRGGQGYFDVRGKEDDWVRVQLNKDDLLILPPGIYHRFTTDDSNVSDRLIPKFTIRLRMMLNFTLEVHPRYAPFPGRAQVDPFEPQLRTQ